MDENTLKAVVAPIGIVLVIAVAVPLVLNQLFVGPAASSKQTLTLDKTEAEANLRRNKARLADYRADVGERNAIWDSRQLNEEILLPANPAEARTILSELSEQVRSNKKKAESGTPSVYQMEIQIEEPEEYGERLMMAFSVRLFAPTDVAVELMRTIEAFAVERNGRMIEERYLAQPNLLEVQGAAPERDGLHEWEIEYLFPLRLPVDRTEPKAPALPKVPEKEGA